MAKKQNNNAVLGTVLIAVGLIFLAREFDIPYIDQLFTWQWMMVGIGLVLILFSGRGKDGGLILPGVILIGLGIHFWGTSFFSWWPTHWAIFTFIVSIGFFMYSARTKSAGASIPGIILLLISIIAFFFSGLWFFIAKTFNLLENWWPVLLILVGVYLLFSQFKRR
ncbi:hypothetical protein L1765_01430 [Microaerobacter geothermalis]|uniref:hypothetical protein n=1 Tax=Microaerobacter geothermalis TaxID=674972 RepID=UPI001F288AC2|nr:hypothetical protein [Microaerobacter geothermalis]MCF6092653.1 hypothetical protein [Microaerobacter geothermalis]